MILRDGNNMDKYMDKAIDKDKIIQSIVNENIDYSGLINFASRGIKPDLNGLLKAFDYGKEIGIECTKKDAIRIINEN